MFPLAKRARQLRCAALSGQEPWESGHTCQSLRALGCSGHRGHTPPPPADEALLLLKALYFRYRQRSSIFLHGLCISQCPPVAIAVIQDTNAPSDKYAIFSKEDVSTVLLRDEPIWWGDCAAPQERRTFMCKPIKTLLLVLVLLVGSTSYADARSRHGGSRGGGYGHGHRHYAHTTRHYTPHHRYGHVHRVYPRYYGGVFFDVPPVWVTPVPSISIVPAPPPAPVWYYCTDPAGYYPTVSACTVPWTPVAPSG